MWRWVHRLYSMYIGNLLQCIVIGKVVFLALYLVCVWRRYLNRNVLSQSAMRCPR